MYTIPSKNVLGKQDKSILEKGNVALANGDTLQALDIWMQGKTELETPDPRIGISFIRTATDAGITDYYEFASLMYGWGLEAGVVEPFTDALEEEVDRLKPLVGDGKFRSWKKLIKNRDAAIYDQITGFWKQMDPTPFSSYNERLIEHWERIAYAKEHFNRGNKTPYGTDVRGEIYLKYGKPNRIKKGVLQFNLGQVKKSIQDMVASNLRLQGRDPTPAYGSSPAIEYLVQHARNHHSYPEYEVWVYRNLTPGNTDNTIYIFGSDGNTGGFTILDSVGDMVSNLAFTMATRDSRIRSMPAAYRNVPVGVGLTVAYYDQLATADGYFGDRLSSIESRISSAGASRSLAQEMKTSEFFDLKENRLKAPTEESDYENQMIDIPIQVHQYRLVDARGRPYLASFMQTRPQQAFLIDYYHNYGQTLSSATDSLTETQRRQTQTNLSNYRLVHGVQVYDEDWTLLTQGRHEPVIVTTGEARSSSLFTVPHVGEGVPQVFAAELNNFDEQSRYGQPGLPFPNELRGMGRAEVEQPEPLTAAPSELLMGDLLLGYDRREEAEPGELFPFTVAHDRKIPAGEALMMHVEVYRLQQDLDGITDFSLGYQIQPVNFLGWTQKRKEEFRLTLNLQTDTPAYRENLEIKTQGLEPGKYELQVTAADKRSGREAERKVRFEVVEILDE